MEFSGKERVFARIYLDNLAFNFNKAKELAGDRKVLAVVKADAYGHGVLPVARELEAAGADYFAVATAQEALELRDNGIDTPILILGYIPPECVLELAERSITVSIGGIEEAREYEDKLGNQKIKAHIKVDTGMSRLGIDAHDPKEAASEIAEIAELENIYIEGIFTHFASADTKKGEKFTKIQYDRFTKTIDEAQKLNVNFCIKHCANSAAVIQYKKVHMDMVRAGIMLYGAPPDDEMANACELKPVMTLCTKVARVRDICKEDSVSYGCLWSPEKKSKIATCMIGYADGLHRNLSGKFCMTVNGESAPQVGRICMDMCMIDLTDKMNVDVGSEVEIFGKANPIENMAQLAGTISYELTCAVSKRVPRMYIKDGKVYEKELLLRG